MLIIISFFVCFEHTLKLGVKAFAYSLMRNIFVFTIRITCYLKLFNQILCFFVTALVKKRYAKDISHTRFIHNLKLTNGTERKISQQFVSAHNKVHALVRDERNPRHT